MSVGHGVSGWRRRGGAGTLTWAAGTAAGVRVPNPRCRFCCVDYMWPPLPGMEGHRRFSDRHGIRQEGPIVPAESMSLGLKVETNVLASPN